MVTQCSVHVGMLIFAFSCCCVQDTGVSVRKRVIKIFRDICLSQPDFEKIPEMCMRMITRIDDEETIRVSMLSAVGVIYAE